MWGIIILSAIFCLNAKCSPVLEDPAPSHTVTGTDIDQVHAFGMDLLTSNSISGENRASFIASLFKQDPMQAYRLAVEMDAEGKLADADRRAFGESIYRAVTEKNYAQLNPAFLQKLIADDAEAQFRLCEALSKMNHDERAIPWFGQFLDSSNPQTQFCAMESLQFFQGPAEKSLLPGKPNPQHPTSAYPPEVTVPYHAWVKTWLEKHPQDAIPGPALSK